MRARSFPLGLAALAVCCAPAIDPEPWVLPVPADTPIQVHPPIAPDERPADTIDLAEDLVIGGGSSPILFGASPPRLALADDGRLVVLDPSNHRVLVLSPDGEVLTEVARRGQGPGEIGAATDMYVAAGVIHVEDVVNRRWNRWRLDGELLDSVPLRVLGGGSVPVGDDEVVWKQGIRKEVGQDLSVRRVDATGAEVLELVRMPWPERVIDPPRGEITDSEPDAWWVGTVPPTHTASPDGDVIYVIPHRDYQIYAYDPTGGLLWALQRPGMRYPLTQQEIDLHMEIHARRFPQRSASQIDWPELQSALAHVAVDGHGHVYAFPYVAKGTPTDQPRPVDVYDRDGRALFSGWIEGRLFSTAFASYNGPMLEYGWQAARGDHVWGVAVQPEAGEREIVRYRITEPF